MQKNTITPAKKLKIEMILRDLRARDLVKHVGASHSLIEKLMTGQIGEVSADMARRINCFFGKRVFPVRGAKKAKESRSVHLSGADTPTNTLPLKSESENQHREQKEPLADTLGKRSPTAIKAVNSTTKARRPSCGAF